MKEKTNKAVYGLFALLYAAFAAMSYRLYLRQAIGFPGKYGSYDSDLRAHITEGLQHTAYSLMERSFGFLMGTMKQNEKAVALWLALLTIATVFITWKVMQRLFPWGHPVVLHFLAFASMFVMPLYLRSVNPYRYLGLQSGNIWHNSTYLGMKFAAMLVLYLYYEYQDTYQSGLSAGKWVLFTLSLIFVNLMKPNFILCFAPAMAVMLMGDCIASRGKTLKQQVIFGIPVLISLAVVVYETLVLFTGERSDSHIVINFAYGLKLWNAHPVAALIQSAAFPLLILAGSFHSLKTERSYRVTWLIWLFGLLEYLFLGETGARQNHGNFSWGYSFCMFLVFIYTIGILYRRLRELYQMYRSSGAAGLCSWVKASGWKVQGKLLYLLAAVFLLLWHLYCGLTFSWLAFWGCSYIC